MDILIAQIQADLRSSDALRQSGALLQALQQSAAGRDVSAVARSTCEEILASPASAVSKKLAFDLIRSTRLTPDLWDTVCSAVRADLDFPDPDVAAAAVSILSAIPSHRLPRLVADAHREIAACFDSPSETLRLAATETLGCVLARDDLVLLCDSAPGLLDRASAWWARIAEGMLDRSDAVSCAAFDAVGRLFQEFETKRMSRLAGDKLIDGENSLAIRSNWVVAAIDLVWKKRNALMARSLIIPVESFRATVFPLVYAAKAVASGSLEVFRKLSRHGESSNNRGTATAVDSSMSAEKHVGVSDVVSHLLPFLSSLDPPLIFEVGINMLSLADVRGGKPEWASASIIAILTLWDRQEFSSARESIVRAVVTNLHLLDLSMQVSLFKMLLLMVRNLRAESDRMHALACICRTALCVDLFAKESVRRGQKPLPGTDITSLFEDARIKDDLNSVTSKGLFREELVASLVESCFQLSLPLPEQKNSGTEGRVIGALAYGTGYGALNWTESALEVVEVCRPCVLWDCDGRTYAIDCYLKLLVRLCHIYDTRGGVKRIKDGASQEQILNETRLRNLQLQLIKDLREVHTPRISARLIWAIAEHFDMEGLDPLLADDLEDPLNIIISNIHNVLFNTESSATTANRLQDVQAILICAQRLVDFARMWLDWLVWMNIIPEESTLAESTRWVGVSETTGDYPFSHHKLTVQFFETSVAQDRKLEGLVHKAIQELWRHDPSELSLLLTKGIDSTGHKVPPKPHTLTGSSDPCYVEAYHLADSTDGRITLHLKDPVLSSVTVGVSHFERCALWVQVLYYPFYGSGVSGDYVGDYAEEDSQILQQKRSQKPELGEPVILRCAYTYEGSGFKATAAQQYEASPFLSGLRSLASKPFHQVCSHFIRTVAGFQLCYAAKTWYGGFVGMMIFGASEVSRNVDLGDETTTMMCKFVIRASDPSITKEIGSDLQGWLDDVTDGGVEYMPEEEVKTAAAERLRNSMEKIALFKAAKPPPQPPKEEEEEDEDQKKKENDDENDLPHRLSFLVPARDFEFPCCDLPLPVDRICIWIAAASLAATVGLEAVAIAEEKGRRPSGRRLAPSHDMAASGGSQHRCVFVGNIPYDATEEQLIQICEEVGPVVSFRLVFDRETGKPKGYGFCEYKDEETALSARRNLQGYEINGRQLRVDFAENDKNADRNREQGRGGPGLASSADVQKQFSGAPILGDSTLHQPLGLSLAATAASVMAGVLGGAQTSNAQNVLQSQPGVGNDPLTHYLSRLSRHQLHEIMSEIKALTTKNKALAHQLLQASPQLSKALFQAQIMLGMVTPQMMQMAGSGQSSISSSQFSSHLGQASSQTLGGKLSKPPETLVPITSQSPVILKQASLPIQQVHIQPQYQLPPLPQGQVLQGTLPSSWPQSIGSVPLQPSPLSSSICPISQSQTPLSQQPVPTVASLTHHPQLAHPSTALQQPNLSRQSISQARLFNK
ncbi:hypothetical protein MUK42_14296 [Musa troglodytarum]|uniref:RRM domain-containing protein n=1 Tax=Musa troglodytarum TaxID=320322 RepID=A0A9E7LFX9_9LILI|nr:hypothetical protein MUK42_14296 [Musa troglodytarum]